MQQPQSQGAGASNELRADAQKLGNTAANRIHSEVDARKGTAATQAKSLSNAIQTAGRQLDDGAPAWLKSAFQQGADQIQRFADTLEQKDSRQILSDVQTFARQRPAMFLGACAAAGFAAARLFKAGGEYQSHQQFDQGSGSDQSEPWGSGERSFAGSDSFSEPTSSAPFVAGPTPSQPVEQDPLILGADDATGTRSTRQGEFQ